MRAYGPYFADGGDGYDWRVGRARRQRLWAVSGGGRLEGYAQFLNGTTDEIIANGAGVVSAELAAANNSAWLRPILIGVATSAAALIVNRWIERTFFK